MSVNNEKNQVMLRMDTRFYNKSSIMCAAMEFTETCWVNIDSDTHNTVNISISPKQEFTDLSILGYEFYNFVLGMMQNASF